MATFDDKKLLEISDSAEVLNHLRGYTSQFGLDKTFLSTFHEDATLEIKRMSANDWPEDFLKFREDIGAELIDPVVLMGLSACTTFNWNDARKKSSAPGRRLLDVGAEFGLSEGIFIPVRMQHLAPGCISIGGERVELSPFEALDVESACKKAFIRILQIENIDDQAIQKITQRQSEVLTLAAADLKNSQIAEQLGISADTVKFHLATAFKILNVKSRAAAVSKAILSTQLSPHPAIRIKPYG